MNRSAQLQNFDLLSHPPRVRDYDPPWLSPEELQALNDYLILRCAPSDCNISDFGDYRDLYGLGPDGYY